MQPGKPLENGLVEALADAIGLRATRLGPRMLDVIPTEVQLIGMRFKFVAQLHLAAVRMRMKHIS